MSVLYLHVGFEAYKSLEDQMRAFKETTHTTTGGFYHKSIRLKVNDDLIIEVHGPLVGGYGHDLGKRYIVEEHHHNELGYNDNIHPWADVS